MQEKLSYKLPVFEGSLDLLLFLLNKNKLNIHDIQITEILDQYMEHVKAIKEENPDIASDFVEMSATLVYIKTESLLPKHEAADEMKRELEDRLIIYQRCKLSARQLAESAAFDTFSRKPAEIDIDCSYKLFHPASELFSAYGAATSRGQKMLPPSPAAFKELVAVPRVSVTSRIIRILRRIKKEAKLCFSSLFNGKGSKSELVASFLAVLELIRAGRVRMEETEDGEIFLYGSEGVGAKKA